MFAAVTSPLAEGADGLVAEEAITLRMPLTVPLPTPMELHVRDFATPQTREHFEQLFAHCHVLLALWNGKTSDQLGGTSQVVRFRHHDVMLGYTPRATTSRASSLRPGSGFVARTPSPGREFDIIPVASGPAAIPVDPPGIRV